MAKLSGFVTVPIMIDGQNMGARVDMNYFIALYLNAKMKDMEAMEIPVQLNGQSYSARIDFSMAERLIHQVTLLVTDIIPKKFREYFKDVTQQVLTKDIQPLVGRDDEIEKVWFYLSQKTRNNVSLIGETEVGKTAIAREITRQIATGECPKEFADYRVIMFKPNSLTHIFSDKEDDEKYQRKVIQKILDFLYKNKGKVIVFIDKAILMKTDYGLITMLNAMLTKYNIPTIMTASVEDYEDYFLNDFILSKYVNNVYVEEPELNEVQPMIMNHIERLEKKYKLKISDQMIKFGIYTSELTNSVSKNPGNSINVFRKAFLEAKRKGKKRVDKKSILSCYDSYLKLYNSSSEKEKLATAYHETGHYIAVMMSEKMKDIKVAFVSILPMMTFLGVNWLYHDINEESFTSRDYYMDDVIVDLAGRVAEKRIINEKTSGAVSDLEHANNVAKAMIMKFGLSEDDHNSNRFYDYEDYFLMPESKKRLLDKEIQSIIDEAYEKAEKIISDNEDLLKIIAEKLVKEEILTGEQLERICRKHFRDKKKLEKK